MPDLKPQQLHNAGDVVAHVINTLLQLHSDDQCAEVILQRVMERRTIRFDNEDPAGGYEIINQLNTWLPKLRPAETVRIFILVNADGVRRVYGYHVDAQFVVRTIPAPEIAGIYSRFGLPDELRICAERPLTI